MLNEKYKKCANWSSLAKVLRTMMKKNAKEIKARNIEGAVNPDEKQQIEGAYKRNLENIEKINAKTLKAFFQHHGIKNTTDFFRATDFILSLMAFGSGYKRPWAHLRIFDFAEGGLELNGAFLQYKDYIALKKGVA